MADTVNVLYGSVRENDSKIRLKIALCLRRIVKTLHCKGQVLRMNVWLRVGCRGIKALRIETKDPECFRRPDPLFRSDLPCPATQMSDPLRFGQVSLTLSQLFLRTLALGNLVPQLLVDRDELRSPPRHALLQFRVRPRQSILGLFS